MVLLLLFLGNWRNGPWSKKGQKLNKIMSQFFYYDTLRSTGDSNSRRGFLTEYKQWRKRNFIDLGDTGTRLQLLYFFPASRSGIRQSVGGDQSQSKTHLFANQRRRETGGGAAGAKKIIMLPPLYFPHTQVAHFLFPRNFLSLTQKRKNIEQTTQSQFD